MSKHQVTFINGPNHGNLSDTQYPLRDGDIITTHSYPELRSYAADVDLRGGLYNLIKSKFRVWGKYAYYLGQSVTGLEQD